MVCVIICRDLNIYRNVSAETEIAAQETEAETYYVVTYNDDDRVEIVP